MGLIKGYKEKTIVIANNVFMIYDCNLHLHLLDKSVLLVKVSGLSRYTYSKQ